MINQGNSEENKLHNENNPDISVIIPLYNKEKNIKRAITSILKQSYTNFEIIIIDDGSTDNSVEEVKNINHSKIRFYKQNNSGPGCARNNGASFSKAKYITFIDADDEWESTFLEKTISVIEKEKHDVILCSHFVGEKKKDLTDVFISKNLKQGELFRSEFKYPIKYYENAISFFIVGNFIIRREKFNYLGGFFSKRKSLIGEDRFLFIKMMFGCNCYIIMEPLIWYHSENSNLFYGRKRYNLLPEFIYDESLINLIPGKEKKIKIFLNKEALRYAHIYEKRNQLIKVKYLIQKFPGMMNWPISFLKLIIKLKINLVKSIINSID